MNPEQMYLRGEVCPMTFVRVRLCLEQARLGSTLDVQLDYEPATRSIPRSLKILGQAFEQCESIGPNLWRLRIRKIIADPTERQRASNEVDHHG